LAGARDAFVALAAYVPKEMTSQFQADKLIRQIAPIVGGKGGGRADLAQGAGRDPGGLAAALAAARKVLRGDGATAAARAGRAAAPPHGGARVITNVAASAATSTRK